MAQVRLPDHLRTAKGRGPVSWYVRAVWEEFAGWYRAESVTDLYGSRPNDIWPELVEMSGGPVALLFRAASKLDAGEPVAALHFIDIVLAVNAGDGDALSLKARVLETLLEQDANEHYDLSRFLEMEIRRARATETRP